MNNSQFTSDFLSSYISQTKKMERFALQPLSGQAKSKKFFGYGPDLHFRKIIAVYFLKVAENPKHTAILY